MALSAVRTNPMTSCVLEIPSALYRAGEFSRALELMNESLASGVKDARLFRLAGIIHKAFSPNGQADSYLQMAAAINPHYENFHVHR